MKNILNSKTLAMGLVMTGMMAVDMPIAQADQWVEITPSNLPRSRPALAYVSDNNKFYLVGGETTGGDRNVPIEEYDPATSSWTNKSFLNVGVSNIGVAVVDGMIYIPGGWDGSVARTELQVYDPVNDVVSLETALPAGNFAHAVVAFGTNIHVMGSDSTGAAGTTHLIYDTITDTWSSGAATPFATNYPGATTDGTFIYLVGGTNTDLAFVEQYDPGLDSWSTFTSLNVGRGGVGAFYDGESLHAVGGGWTSFLTSTETFDGLNWVAGNSINVGARTFGLAYGNGYAMKANGWAGAYLNNVEINDQIFANSLEP